MKLIPPANPNYAATVIRVKNLVPLANCDNVVGLPLMGMQAIVGKDTKVDDLGILFPTEVQLSEEYLRFNNLYRHTELNADPNAKAGYFEYNGRVKSMKFRGHRSDAFFMPLESLLFAYGGNDQIIPKRPTEQVISYLGSNATVKLYPRGYHMLLRDLDGGTRWSDIAFWIAQQAHMRAGPQTASTGAALSP